jgi:hypothetical protein
MPLLEMLLLLLLLCKSILLCLNCAGVVAMLPGCGRCAGVAGWLSVACPLYDWWGPFDRLSRNRSCRPCLQLKVSEQQERLTTLQLSEAETRRQLDIALAELSATRNSAAGAESAASEAVGLRRALAEAERQMNGAGAELSELSRQLAEAKGQRDASQVRVTSSRVFLRVL